MQMAASHTMKKMYTAKPTPPPQNQHQDSETEDCFKNGRIQDSEAELVYIYIYYIYTIIEGRLEVKLPTIWTDEKQSREEAERRERSEERRVEEKE